MNNDKLVNLLGQVSYNQAEELEILVVIYQKSIELCVYSYLDFLKNEFDQACERYKKSKSSVEEFNQEIIGGYENEFDKMVIKEEEQFVNLVKKVQEIQDKEKEILIKYINYSIDDSIANKNQDIINNYIYIYNYYNSLEDECFKMINESLLRLPFWMKNVMKSESGSLIKKEEKSFLQRIMSFFSNIFISNKFEKEYLEIKRKMLQEVSKNTEDVTKEIRKKTVNDLKIIVAYQIKIESSGEANGQI